jgi:hypothetical protein
MIQSLLSKKSRASLKFLALAGIDTANRQTLAINSIPPLSVMPLMLGT